MANLINLKETNSQITAAVKAFQGFDREIETQIDILNSVPKYISDKQTRDAIHSYLSEAARTLREYEKLRLETTRPLDGLKAAVIAYQKDTIGPLESLINDLKEKVMKFDQEQERKRLEELARLEAERKAREEADRVERERVGNIRGKMAIVEREFLIGIDSCKSPEDVDQGIDRLAVEFSEFDWQEFGDEAETLYNRLESQAQTKKAHLIEMARIRAEQEAAAKESRAAAEALAAEKARQAEEARKIQEERERLERERIENERRKAELEAEQARQAEERAKLEAEQARRKELEAARAKGISSGIENIKITDLSLVPTDLYEVKFNLNKVSAALKRGDIPGLEITFKSKLVLNAK